MAGLRLAPLAPTINPSRARRPEHAILSSAKLEHQTDGRRYRLWRRRPARSNARPKKALDSSLQLTERSTSFISPAASESGLMICAKASECHSPLVKVRKVRERRT